MNKKEKMKKYIDFLWSRTQQGSRNPLIEEPLEEIELSEKAQKISKIIEESDFGCCRKESVCKLVSALLDEDVSMPKETNVPPINWDSVPPFACIVFANNSNNNTEIFLDVENEEDIKTITDGEVMSWNPIDRLEDDIADTATNDEIVRYATKDEITELLKNSNTFEELDNIIKLFIR